MDKWLRMVKSTTPASYLREHFRKNISISLDDPIVGAFNLKFPLNLLLDTFEFNRLHRIHQSGLLYLVKPSATYTRLAHTIGSAALADRCFNSMVQRGDFKKLGFSRKRIEKNRTYLIAGMMLHDIGHPPFSHALEPILKEKVGLNHEEITSNLILGEGDSNDVFKTRFEKLSENIGDLGLKKVSEKINEINSSGALKFELNKKILSSLIKTEEPSKEMDLFENEGVLPCLRKLISNNIDIDRLDHYARDIYFLGFRPITFDPIKIASNFSIVRKKGECKLCIKEEAAPYVMGLLLVKDMLYRFVWSEPNNIGYTVMLIRALERAFDDYPKKFNKFYSWTDEELITSLANLNNTISETLAKQLILRCQMYEFSGKCTSRDLGKRYEKFCKKKTLKCFEGKIIEQLKKEEPNVINDAVILFSEKGLELEEINTEVLKSNGEIEMLNKLDKYKEMVSFYEKKDRGKEVRIYCFQPLVKKVSRITGKLISKY